MHKILKDDWEFATLGVYNYRQPGRLKYYFDFVRDNHKNIEGDILEAGVHKGVSLIGMGLFLKEIGSDKIIYGYDTWKGFPSVYHKYDDQSQWEKLFKAGRISKENFEKVALQKAHRGFSLGVGKKELSAKNLSLSGDFGACSREDVQAKLDYLGLDNVKLIEGPFSETMTAGKAPFQKLSAAIIDADLYMSYKVCLPFIWQYLEKGGYIWLDEYYSLKFPGARIATDEFFADKKEKPEMHPFIDYDFERWYVRRTHD